MNRAWATASTRNGQCNVRLRALTLGLGKGHEAVPSKRLLIHLLQALSNAGWHLAATPELYVWLTWDPDVEGTVLASSNSSP